MDTLKERGIVLRAVEKLNQLVRNENCELNDGDSFVSNGTVQIEGQFFNYEIQRSITNANFNKILDARSRLKKNGNRPVLLIAEYISPGLFDKFIQNDINVLDCSGNCSIKQDGLFIFIQGRKNKLAKEKYGCAFRKSGLKLVLYLLRDEQNVARPYRIIQDATNLSLGTIKDVICDLTDKNYILVTNNGRALKNKQELIDKWVDGYNTVLKPKLKLGSLSFVSKEKRERWMDMKLPQGMLWGGECAAFLKQGFLVPGSYELYSKESLNSLYRTGNVLPDENGVITVYENFWDTGDSFEMPWQIIYADLMGSGDGRCLEAAKRIIEDADFK